jgi:hypothetical protein
MASIYEHLFDRLPKVRKPIGGDDPKHHEKVQQAKAEFEADPEFKRQASWLFAQYAALRRQKDEIEAALSDCQVELDAMTQLLEDQLDVEGSDSLRLTNGDKVRLEPGIYPKITNAEEFRQWCLADPDLSKKMVLNTQTAQSLVRKMLLAGQAEPPGVEAVVYNKVVFTKGE